MRIVLFTFDEKGLMVKWLFLHNYLLFFCRKFVAAVPKEYKKDISSIFEFLTISGRNTHEDKFMQVQTDSKIDKHAFI